SKRGPSRFARGKFLCADRAFSSLRLTIARRRPHRIRQAGLLRTVASRVPSNRAPVESEADLSFDRAGDDRCARSQTVSDRVAQPSPASLLRPTRRRLGRDLFHAAAAKFSVRRRKLLRAFLHCRREFHSNWPARAKTARSRNRASV